MVLKGEVRNEHREAWREGRFAEIPADAMAILEANYPLEKFKAVESKKPEKKDKKEAE